MKILITGAGGWIGQSLSRKLFLEGHDLVVSSRNPRKLGSSLEVPCEAFAWDPMKGLAPPEMLRGVDAVIHLAGEPIAASRWTSGQKKKILESRQIGTRNLVKSLAKMPQKPKVLISASAIGYYGNSSQELDETGPNGKGFLAEVCQAWESEALALFDQIRTVVVRTGVVLHPSGGALEKMLPAFDARVGGILGSGQQWMSWIHLDDLVSIYLKALMDEEISGPVNGTAPEPVQNSAFTNLLAKQLRVPAFLSAPSVALNAAFGEMSQVLLEGQKVVPKMLEAHGFSFRYPALKDALEDFFPSSDEAGVRRFSAAQFFLKPVGEVFRFFCSQKNLEGVMPPSLHLKLSTMSTSELQESTRVEYQLKVHGLPVKWVSEIRNWVPEKSFKDVQLKGPYSVWEHEHVFEEVRGGTLVRDRIRWKAPGGPLRAFVSPLVSSDLKKIFAERKIRIAEMLAR